MSLTNTDARIIGRAFGKLGATQKDCAELYQGLASVPFFGSTGIFPFDAFFDGWRDGLRMKEEAEK